MTTTMHGTATTPTATARPPAGADATPTTHVRWVRHYVWQLPIRIFHWVFAAATVVLFVTGLWIGWPAVSASGESYDTFVMSYVRLVHFAAGYVFAVMFAYRLLYVFLGNRYARSGFPFVWRRSWWRALGRQVREYATLNIERDELGHNALAGLSYAIFPLGLGLLQILTGFALYGESNPGGFWDQWTGWVLPLFGGSFQTHMWHQLFAWGFVVFVILHLYIVFADSHFYRNGLVGSMISGEKFVRESDDEEDA